MPSFAGPRPVRSTKILYLGHTGAGKTGSLCSLAAAGYDVRILDLDAGVDIIFDYLTNEKSIYTRARAGLWTAEQARTIAERMSYVTITEGHRLIGTQSIPRGDSWAKVTAQLNDWKDGDRRLGNIATWPSEAVLVIDGLSRLCESAMNFQLSLNGRLATGPQVGDSGNNDYTHAYKLIIDLLDMLKMDEIKCNVIMVCHIGFLNAPETIAAGQARSRDRELKGFPQVIGPKIAPMIGQYFNTMLQAKAVGRQRRIATATEDRIELKNVAPLRVKDSYPLETGLAEYFRDISSGIVAPREEVKAAE